MLRQQHGRVCFQLARAPLAMGLAITLGGCVGDDGDQGPQGAQGPSGPEGPQGAATVALEQTGRYAPVDAPFDEGAAEIVSYNKGTQEIFLVNANAGVAQILDISSPANPTKSGDDINAASDVEDDNGLNDGAMGNVNSVAVGGGTVAVAVAADDEQANGYVAFYQATDRTFLGSVEVGALPDMVTFADDSTVLVANEGEPNDDYSIDPEGSVSVIDISGGVASASEKKAEFTAFNQGNAKADELPDDVRIFGNQGVQGLGVTSVADTDPATVTVDDASGISVGQWVTIASNDDPVAYRVTGKSGDTLTLHDELDDDTKDYDQLGDLAVYPYEGGSTVAQDLEPEYITVAEDGKTAWVSLQENNALARVDVAAAEISAIQALGFKNHNVPGMGLDASDEDGPAEEGAVNIQTHPIFGVYMPDSVASFDQNGETYVLTANEGDAREYDALSEEISLDAFEGQIDSDFDYSDVFKDENAGDLDSTFTLGDEDGDDKVEKLYSYGARSFSIRDGQGNLIFDSGDEFARKVAEVAPEHFNVDNDDDLGAEERSTAKGTEPEALAVGEVDGRTFAFIGLERQGGIMVYDVTNPHDADFVQYTSNRDFTEDRFLEKDVDNDGDKEEVANPAAGDIGPEGMVFVPAAASPRDRPLLIVGNEVSGSTSIYRIVLR